MLSYPPERGKKRKKTGKSSFRSVNVCVLWHLVPMRNVPVFHSSRPPPTPRPIQEHIGCLLHHLLPWLCLLLCACQSSDTARACVYPRILSIYHEYIWECVFWILLLSMSSLKKKQRPLGYQRFLTLHAQLHLSLLVCGASYPSNPCRPRPAPLRRAGRSLLSSFTETSTNVPQHLLLL